MSDPSAQPPPALPTPVPGPESGPYWEAAARHQLLLPACRRCGHVWAPPTVRCPACLTADPEWRAMSGRGRVFTFTVFRRAYHPAYRDALPYVVAVVELEEGPRMVTNIVGCPPEDVACDLPVRVTFEARGEHVLTQFTPAR